MEPKDSLLHSKVPATCPFAEPEQIQSVPPSPTSLRSILLLSCPFYYYPAIQT